MADRRGALVPLLIIFFIFSSSNTSPRFREHDARPRIEDIVAEEQRSLSILQNSTFADTTQGLNLTGLEPDRGYAWDALSDIKARAAEQLEYALGEWGMKEVETGALDERSTALYNNVTGLVHGRWVRSKVQGKVALPQLNLSAYAPEGPFGGPPQPRPFGRNITGDGGDVAVRFKEKEAFFGERGIALSAVNVTEMSIELNLQDDVTSDEWEIVLRGVYFPTIGQAILTTTSNKFAGIFLLPHLTPSQRMFDLAKTVLNESISEVIRDQVNHYITSLNPWTANSLEFAQSPFSALDCEIILFLQQLTPATTQAYSNTALSFLDRELRFPSGTFLPPVPQLRFSMLAFSPDCGYVLESKGPPDYVPQEGNHLTGPKIEALYKRGRSHLLVYSLVQALQLALLMRQMREASTLPMRTRLSYNTIAGMALCDAFSFLIFCGLGLMLNDLWVNLMASAALCFVSGCFMGMRFVMEIWTVQAPEREVVAREEQEAERQRLERINAALQRLREERLQRIAAARGPPPASTVTTSDTAVDESPAATDALESARLSSGEPLLPTTNQQVEQHPPAPASLPLSITIQRPTDTGATPVFMPSDQAGLLPIAQPGGPTATGDVPLQMPAFGSWYARFYLLLLIIFFVSANAASWPSRARKTYFTLLGTIYLSFWIPQITRNVQRNCRRALNWEFVLGQSVLRLLPFAYFYGFEHNVLFARKDYVTLVLMAGWLWVQVVILGSQEIIGPRWFVRKDWAPPAYDYHPILREDEEGDTLPLGLADSASSAPNSPLVERSGSVGSPGTARRGSVAKETKDKGKRVFDCAICMQDLEVPIIEPGGPSESSVLGGMMLARRQYMVTPCRHIFHSSCLEGWMKYRLQCPICREGLPPI